MGIFTIFAPDADIHQPKADKPEKYVNGFIWLIQPTRDIFLSPMPGFQTRPRENDLFHGWHYFERGVYENDWGVSMKIYLNNDLFAGPGMRFQLNSRWLGEWRRLVR